VLDAGKKSDAQTMAMSAGKANVMDVVTAVAASLPSSAPISTAAATTGWRWP
jgi:hypothetical protein